jgi:prohibitin 2
MFTLSIILIILAAVLIGVGSATKESGWHLGGWTSAGLGAILLLLSCFYIVQPGQIGIEVLFGKVKEYSQAGLQSKNPMANIIRYDCRTMKEDHKAEGMSKDMQLVTVESVINYRIDFTRIADLYSKVGIDYSEKIIGPSIQESVKAICARYNVEEITVNRARLKLEIEDLLSIKMSNFYIILQDVNLVDIDFSAEFNKVLEEKQIQQQQIKVAEYRMEQAEKDKETAILQAQAEAEKQRLLRESVSEKIVQLKYLEKWNGVLPTIVTGDKGMMMFNVNSKGE